MSPTWRRRLGLTLAFVVLMGIALYAGSLKNRERTVETARLSVSLLAADDDGELPRPLRFTLDAEIAEGGDLIRMVMHPPAPRPGRPERPSIELVLSGREDVYLHAPEKDNGLPPGKSWILMDLREAGRVPAGFDGLGSFVNSDQFLTTTSYSDEEEMGRETVAGVETTRFELSASLSEMDAALDVPAKSLARFGAATGGVLEMTAWVDDDGFTRRLWVPLDGSYFGPRASVDAIIQYDVHDLGDDVDVEVPDPAEVATY